MRPLADTLPTTTPTLPLPSGDKLPMGDVDEPPILRDRSLSDVQDGVRVKDRPRGESPSCSVDRPRVGGDSKEEEEDTDCMTCDGGDAGLAGIGIFTGVGVGGGAGDNVGVTIGCDGLVIFGEAMGVGELELGGLGSTVSTLSSWPPLESSWGSCLLVRW